jgi:hypothetical protein
MAHNETTGTGWTPLPVIAGCCHPQIAGIRQPCQRCHAELAVAAGRAGRRARPRHLRAGTPPGAPPGLGPVGPAAPQGGQAALNAEAVVRTVLFGVAGRLDLAPPGAGSALLWGLVARAWAMSCPVCPLRRALVRSSGRKHPAWPVRLAVKVMAVRSSPGQAPRRSASWPSAWPVRSSVSSPLCGPWPGRSDEVGNPAPAGRDHRLGGTTPSATSSAVSSGASSLMHRAL